MKQLISAVVTLAILHAAAPAQVRVQIISPPATDSRIGTTHGPDIALDDPTAPSRGLLILMIEGTGAPASSCRNIDSCFATMGFHAVSIDYPNNVITTTCSNSSDSSCFDDFRQEIVFGTPVSRLVTVDSANSIVARFTRLLIYLDRHDPQGGWNSFLDKGRPRWDHIVVAGHSQGAGHAAYLGKFFRLAGVLMLSGPQDYLQVYHRPAPWQFREGKTPPAREFAFLHLRDPFNYHFQAADVSAVTGFAATDTTMVQPRQPVHSTHHILVNDIATREPHISTVFPVFIDVWKYMLRIKSTD